MKNKGIFWSTLLGVFCVISSFLMLIGYKLGYYQAIDDRVDAGECKSSRKWYRLK